MDNPVGPQARVADVIRDRAVWCDGDPCEQLAAGVRVQVGDGVDLRLRVYRTEDGALLADTQLMLGELYGDWTADGRDQADAQRTLTASGLCQ